MTVPGTIAAYYPDATAAFVLSSELEYVIDPRTPLFQGEIQEPRPSHYELAEHLGPSIRRRLGDSDVRHAAIFNASLFTDDVIREITQYVIDFQRNYGGRAANISDKLDRYQRLLQEALHQAQSVRRQRAPRPPAFTLAPYFVSRDWTDAWASVNRGIWRMCLTQPLAEKISPVVAVESPSFLLRALRTVPNGLSPFQFFWIAGFDERRVSVLALQAVWEAVTELEGRSLINLYGGFFSICLHYASLWGFNNGLGYSEARSWPELAATGAAPARYYLPALHAYVVPRLAQLIIDADDFFVCPCRVCASRDGRVLGMAYHDLKRHFVLARGNEIASVLNHPAAAIADSLTEARDRFETEVLPVIPSRLAPDLGYLSRWATTLQRMGS
jgi:hypothetical protein